MLRTHNWVGWMPTQLMGTHVTGKRLGILGMGRIGQAMADRARAFRMQIHYSNRSRLDPALEQGARFHADPETMLEHCDFLSINAPLTAATRKWLNTERIERLPQGAIVINTARGGVVDDDALIAALKSGRLASAGLDVFDGEPKLHGGYYDLPNLLSVPGENLPHVSHYYSEPHEYWNQDVVVIGGKNSSAEAALDLYRNGARVTLVHRGKELGASIKYWVRPDMENRIKAGQIQALLNARVEEITRDEVVLEQHAQIKRVPARQVFALTGYHPDFSFIESLGVKLDAESRRPALDPNTLESNVPGIHLAGVVIGGRHTGEIFIENGRFHGKQIIQALTK